MAETLEGNEFVPIVTVLDESVTDLKSPQISVEVEEIIPSDTDSERTSSEFSNSQKSQEAGLLTPGEAQRETNEDSVPEGSNGTFSDECPSFKDTQNSLHNKSTESDDLSEHANRDPDCHSGCKPELSEDLSAKITPENEIAESALSEHGVQPRDEPITSAVNAMDTHKDEAAEIYLPQEEVFLEAVTKTSEGKMTRMGLQTRAKGARDSLRTFVYRVKRATLDSEHPPCPQYPPPIPPPLDNDEPDASAAISYPSLERVNNNTEISELEKTPPGDGELRKQNSLLHPISFQSSQHKVATNLLNQEQNNTKTKLQRITSRIQSSMRGFPANQGLDKLDASSLNENTTKENNKGLDVGSFTREKLRQINMLASKKGKASLLFRKLDVRASDKLGLAFPRLAKGVKRENQTQELSIANTSDDIEHHANIMMAPSFDEQKHSGSNEHTLRSFFRKSMDSRRAHRFIGYGKATTATLDQATQKSSVTIKSSLAAKKLQKYMLRGMSAIESASYSVRSINTQIMTRASLSSRESGILRSQATTTCDLDSDGPSKAPESALKAAASIAETRKGFTFSRRSALVTDDRADTNYIIPEISAVTNCEKHGAEITEGEA
ncbi:uncharacterized protein V1510DRAFT_407851 [Dipodascopsis tothii]|uniref:uncharacterized protein n=1 Tax=Dipodascopsis tothii TaxID=44089 RepID=UPI0034CD67D9